MFDGFARMDMQGIIYLSFTIYEALIACANNEPRSFIPPSSAVTMRLGISNSTTGTFFSGLPSSASTRLAYE